MSISIKKVFQNTDLLRIIVSYIIPPYYQLLDWVKDFIENNISLFNVEIMKCYMSKYDESFDYLLENSEWKLLSLNGNITYDMIDFINWKYLSKNKNAIHIIKNNIDKINWEYIGENENAIDIIEQNMDKISYDSLVLNKNAIHLIEDFVIEYSGFINLKVKKSVWNKNTWNILKKKKEFSPFIWNNLFRNENIHILFEKYEKNLNWIKMMSYNNCIDFFFKQPYAFDLLKRNIKHVGWRVICTNKNPKIVNFLRQNIDKIYWKELSENPNAILLLEENIDKINWQYLSKNENAIHLLEKYPSKINWKSLLSNPNALDLIKQYSYKINFSSNDIFNNHNIEIIKIYIEFLKTKSRSRYLDNPFIFLLARNKNIFIKNNEKTIKKIDDFTIKLYNDLF